MKRQSDGQTPAAKRRAVDPLDPLDILDTDPGSLILPFLYASDLAALASTSRTNKTRVHTPLHAQLISLVGFRDAMVKGHRYAIRYLYENTPMHIYDDVFTCVVNQAIRLHDAGFIDFLMDIDIPLNRGHVDRCQDMYKLEAFREFGLLPTGNALMIAAQNDNVDVIKYLRAQFGMEPGADTMSVAYREGHMKTTRYLVESGVRPSPNAVEEALDFGLYGGLACYLAGFVVPPEYYVDEILQYPNQLYRDIVRVWLLRGIRPSAAAVNAQAMDGNVDAVKLLASFNIYASKDAILFGIDNGFPELEKYK